MDHISSLALNEYEASLQAVEDEFASNLSSDDEYNAELEISLESPSNLDAWDYAWCLTIAAASTFLTTDKAIEKWLAAIHDKASKKTADTNKLQDLIAKILEHVDPAIDEKTTRTVKVSPEPIYHRLFWGHDIITPKLSDNPFSFMFKNDKFRGVIQVVRHLIADTLSKQGLPIPGHSFLDFEKPNGRPGNYIIEIVRQLAQETHGNKSVNVAEQLYEHLFTIRMQDILGSVLAKILVEAYFKARSIDDGIRKHEIRLIAYTMSFYGEVIFGMVRQKGVPYVNYPLGALMVTAFITFLKSSYDVTRQLERNADLLEREMDRLVTEHEELHIRIINETSATVEGRC